MSRTLFNRILTVSVGVLLLFLFTGCREKGQATDTAKKVSDIPPGTSVLIPPQAPEPEKEKPKPKTPETTPPKKPEETKPAPPQTPPGTTPKLQGLRYVTGSRKCPKTDMEVAGDVSLAVVVASDGMYLETKKAIRLDAKDSAPLFQKGKFLKAGGLIGNNYSKTEPACSLEVKSRNKKWSVDAVQEFYVNQIEPTDLKALNVHLKFKDNDENVWGVLCSKTVILENNKIKPLKVTYAESDPEIPTVGDMKKAFGGAFVVCDEKAH